MTAEEPNILKPVYCTEIAYPTSPHLESIRGPAKAKLRRKQRKIYGLQPKPHILPSTPTPSSGSE